MTPRHPFAVAVVDIVAAAYGIDPEIIWGGERYSPTVTEARWLCWGQAKKVCRWSNVETAKAFCVNDTTVLLCLRKYSARVLDNLCTPWHTAAVQALDKLSLGVWQTAHIDRIASALALDRPLTDASQPMNCEVSGIVAPRAPSVRSGQDLVSDSSSLISSDLKRPVRKRARGPKPRLRNVPETWQPNDGHRALAKELRVDFDAQLVLFRDHEFKDPKSNFDAAFRTWLRRSVAFGKPPGFVEHQRQEAEEAVRRRPELALFKPPTDPKPSERLTAAEIDAAAKRLTGRGTL